MLQLRSGTQWCNRALPCKKPHAIYEDTISTPKWKHRNQHSQDPTLQRTSFTLSILKSRLPFVIRHTYTFISSFAPPAFAKTHATVWPHELHPVTLSTAQPFPC